MDKIDFRVISEKIKEACLCFGMGTIKLDKTIDDLWIDDYENNSMISMHVDTITIDYDEITLREDNQSVLSFEDIFSINRQIEIYDVIYEEQAQIHLYELPDTDFLARKVVDDEGCPFFWRIISNNEARHLFYNGRVEIFRLYDDGSEGVIDSKVDLEDSIKSGYILGIEA